MAHGQERRRVAEDHTEKRDLLGGVLGGVGDVLGGIGDVVGDLATSIVPNVVGDVATKIVPAVVGDVGSVVGDAVSAVDTVVSDVGVLVKTVVSEAASVVSDAVSEVSKVVSNVVKTTSTKSTSTHTTSTKTSIIEISLPTLPPITNPSLSFTTTRKSSSSSSVKPAISSSSRTSNSQPAQKTTTSKSTSAAQSESTSSVAPAAPVSSKSPIITTSVRPVTTSSSASSVTTNAVDVTSSSKTIPVISTSSSAKSKDRLSSSSPSASSAADTRTSSSSTQDWSSRSVAPPSITTSATISVPTSAISTTSSSAVGRANFVAVTDSSLSQEASILASEASVLSQGGALTLTNSLGQTTVLSGAGDASAFGSSLSSIQASATSKGGLGHGGAFSARHHEKSIIAVAVVIGVIVMGALVLIVTEWMKRKRKPGSAATLTRVGSTFLNDPPPPSFTGFPVTFSDTDSATPISSWDLPTPIPPTFRPARDSVIGSTRTSVAGFVSLPTQPLNTPELPITPARKSLRSSVSTRILGSETTTSLRRTFVTRSKPTEEGTNSSSETLPATPPVDETTLRLSDPFRRSIPQYFQGVHHDSDEASLMEDDCGISERPSSTASFATAAESGNQSRETGSLYSEYENAETLVAGLSTKDLDPFADPTPSSQRNSYLSEPSAPRPFSSQTLRPGSYVGDRVESALSYNSDGSLLAALDSFPGVVRS